MSDLVTRIWAGPFEAHATDLTGQLKVVQIGEEIQVTAVQAEENPVWFAPLPDEPAASSPSFAFASDTPDAPDLPEAA